jgi:hypothetical protein
LRVDEDDLVVLVSRVLVDPVGVEDAEIGATTTDTLFSCGTEGSLVLELVDTLVGWLACVANCQSMPPHANCEPSHTVGSTLWRWSLAATTTNSDAVDNVALLGLVPETASLVWTGWTGCAVDNFQLSEPTVMHFSAKFNEVTSAQLQRY